MAGRVNAALGAIAVLLTAACMTLPGSRPVAPAIAIVDAPRRAGMPAILVVMPVTTETRDVWSGLRDELGEDYDIVTLRFDATTTAERIGAMIAATAPACVVLMNNPTVRAYEQWQHTSKAAVFPPAVVLMASFLSDLKGRIRNAAGIAYEVPAITMFVNMRSFLDRPTRRVGVVYRRPFHAFIETQRKLAAIENIELVPIELGGHASAKQLDRALRRLRDAKVDAIWVPNDNGLFATTDHVVSAWLPNLKAAKLPVAVGVRALVNAKVPFGTFAVVPDHEAMGVQAANMILELASNGWRADGTVALPISVKTVLDVPRARRYYRFREDQLSRLDFIVQ
jgi:ABC-type uncharacterized transport system substrate-binding protein